MNPVVAWQAVAQTGAGEWAPSKWTNRTFRLLIEGEHITTSGPTVQVTLRGRGGRGLSGASGVAGETGQADAQWLGGDAASGDLWAELGCWSVGAGGEIGDEVIRCPLRWKWGRMCL